jgi:sugar phosphate isomerase/epimerase
MTALSRRAFGRTVLAGVPLAAWVAPRALRAADALTIGVSTDSFRDLPRITGRDNVDDVIRAVQAARVTHIELALANLEPAPPSTAPFIGGTPAYPQRVVFTPEQVLAMNASARYALRNWRVRSEPGVFEDVRRKLGAAAIAVHACALTYDEVCTDDEIDATFRQVKSLGAGIVSSPMTMAMAKRLAPVAERHHVTVAIHNQVDGNTDGAIATPQLDAALALSPAFAIKLDIGNLTASNADAISVLRRYQPRVSHVLIKDRLRNGGTSQHFGEGDTPIAPVLEALRTSSRAIPAFVEYDYLGLRSPVDEVNACLAFVSR